MMDPHALLVEMFTNTSNEVIENIIRIVDEQCESNTPEEKFEVMVNMLIKTGASDDNIVTIGNDDHYDLLDEAAGFSTTKTLNGDRDKVSDTLNRLLDILPNADPSYLEKNAVKLAYNEDKLEDFIDSHLENQNYPTLENYLERKRGQSEMDKYIFHFKLHQFLLEIPEPIVYFNNPDRKHAFQDSHDEDLEVEVDFALKSLYNQFRCLRKSDIMKVFKICDKNIIKTCNKLKVLPLAFKIARDKETFSNILIKNIPLLQEIAFIEHEKDITLMQLEKEQNFLRAQELGLLETCSCCCSEELIPEDCYLCRKGCKFCKECIRKAAEVAYGEGKTEFRCLANCESDFSLRTLQMVLNPKIFKNLCLRMQMYEINNAHIEGVETCQFCCNFAMIPNPEDKIFHCESCNKDTCRKCKHEAHVPLRCNEIEYDEDVRMRTYIENKMTEALVRKCYRCGTTFIKNSGCNKISCSCGAKMCYLCGAVIKDYSHFSNEGCPLFTNDEEIHRNNVINGANRAKADLGVDKDPDKLKFDPTVGLTS